MKKKYLIFGANGSIGSSLVSKFYSEKFDCHLVGKNEEEIEKLASKFNYSYNNTQNLIPSLNTVFF